MPRFNWVDITYEDVVRAIKKFIMENPEFPEPRSTYLLSKGESFRQSISGEWHIMSIMAWK